MLIDGLKLTEGSNVTNLSVEAGLQFPAQPDEGELFVKTGDGLYYYDAGSWHKVSTLANGKIDPATLPLIAITNTFIVASQAAMLDLDVQTGDVAVRTDSGKTYILAADPATVLSNWVELSATSVAGPVGPTGPQGSTGTTGPVGPTGPQGTFNGTVGYDIATSIFGKPADGEVVLRLRMARAITLPQAQTGAQAKSTTSATSSSVFTLYKNGTSVGTVTFAASSTSGTILLGAPVTLAVGDLLTIVAPATADATLADVDLTLVGTQN